MLKKWGQRRNASQIKLAQSPNNHRLCKICSLTFCLLSTHLWQQIVNLKVCKIRISWVLATFSHLKKNKRTGLLLNYFGESNTKGSSSPADFQCTNTFLRRQKLPWLLFEVEKSTSVSQQSPWTNQEQSPHLLMLFPTNKTNGPKDLPGIKVTAEEWAQLIFWKRR